VKNIRYHARSFHINIQEVLDAAVKLKQLSEVILTRQTGLLGCTVRKQEVLKFFFTSSTRKMMNEISRQRMQAEVLLSYLLSTDKIEQFGRTLWSFHFLI